MNTSNQTSNTDIADMIKKIPPQLYFTETPDRQHALSYIQWLYSNIPQSKTVNQDKLFREVIARELRVISMKTIEIEILIMVALDTIVLDDFTLDSDSLIKKVMAQNTDKYDLDMMYKVMAQIMTKLPRDLKEQVTGVQKLQVFQKVAKFVNIEPKLLEKFMSMDTSLNTPVSMDLDAGDYNTLNKKYLKELQNYKDSQSYVNSDTLENIKTLQQNINSTPTDNVLKAQYIDDNPTIMKGINDNQLYYYDESSGVITEIPSSDNQKPISIDNLESILLANKVNPRDIQSLIDGINNPPSNNPPNPQLPPSPPPPVGFFSSIGHIFTGGAPVQSTAVAPLITTMSGSSRESNSSYNPNPSYTFANSIYSSRYYQNNEKHSLSKKQNLDARYKARDGTYAHNPANASVEAFTNNNPNINSNSTKITEAELIKNMKKNNENIENVAIAFVTIIILLFLLVIFNAIRNKSGLSK